MDRRLLAAVLSGSGPQRLFAYNGGTDPRLSGATHTRADAANGTASYTDSTGTVRFVDANVPRYQHYVSGSGPLLLLEGSRQNVCLRSEDFTAVWIAAGTPTLTPAAFTTSGVSLSLVNDTSAVQSQGYDQTVTLTGDGVKSLSFYIKQGTSTSTMFRLRDTTAPADRCLGFVTWSSGLPVITMSAGTSAGYETLAGGMFRIKATTTSATAANTHQIRLLAAEDASLAGTLTGTAYLGGVQVENAAFPSSYIPTTTAAVTRAADALSFPFLAPPQAMTVYADIYDLGTGIGAAINASVMSIGDASSNNRFQIYGASGAAGFREFYNLNETASGAASSYGNRIELNASISGTGAGVLTQSIGGAASTSVTAALGALQSTFNASVLYVNSVGVSNVGFLALRSLKVAAGVRDLGTMRGL